MTGLVLTVAEPGSGLVSRGPADANAAVLEAGVDWSLAELAWQTIRHIAALEHAGCRISQLEVLTGREYGSRAYAARALIAGALITHAGLDRPGRIVFVADPQLDEVGQRELEELVEQLCRQAIWTKLSVSISTCDSKAQTAA